MVAEEKRPRCLISSFVQGCSFWGRQDFVSFGLARRVGSHGEHGGACVNPHRSLMFTR